MKKWLKKIVFIFGVVLIIIAALFYYSVSSIDTTPYFETKYYSNTIEKLNNAITKREISKGKLKTGFAKINITPKIVDGVENPSKGEFNSIKLSGFGDGKYVTGVHDSIYAKAIAFNVDNNIIVLVSADLLLMPPEVVRKVEKKLKEQYNIRREQLFFGATHTHSSIGNCIPGIVGKEFGGEYQPELVNWLSEKITQLILKSLSNMQPSQVATDYIKATDLISNRIIGKSGRLNDKLTVISVKQQNGNQMAIGVFAAHATTISTWNNQFSGDYPGYFQRGLESKGIDMAMFFAGTVGSHTNRGKGSKFEKPKYIGEALADSAYKVINRMEYSSDVTLSAVTSQIEIPKLQMIYISNNLRLSPEAGHKLMPNMSTTYLQALTINNFLWITMPCELSGEYANDLKNALELKGYNSAITSFNGQYLGYVVPAKYYYFDTYEARLMGWFGPSMGDYLMELNYTMADSLTGEKL